MQIRKLWGGLYASNAYLVVAKDESVLIDPSLSPTEFQKQLGEEAIMPKLILLTHAHFDHMLGLDAWRKLGIPLAVHRMDAPALGDPAKSYFRPFLHREDVFMPPEQELEEGTVIPLGNEFLRVLHTPGHTMGSVCYLGDGVIFTGDTVFTDGDYGRTDLYGGDEMTLFSSIRRLSQLAEKEGDLVMYPGHGGEGNFRAHMKFFG